MRGFLIAVAVMVALTVAAILWDVNRTDSPHAPPPAVREHPLAETDWLLMELGRADSLDAAEGNAGIEFSVNLVSGWTGCNSYKGEYSVEGEVLRLHDVGATEAGCRPDALFRQEQRMLESLWTVERFEVAGDRLTLHSTGGQVLVFKARQSR